MYTHTCMYNTKARDLWWSITLSGIRLSYTEGKGSAEISGVYDVRESVQGDFVIAKDYYRIIFVSCKWKDW